MSYFINSTVNTKFYNLMSDEHQIITITDKEAVVENIGTIVSGDTNSCLLTFEINRFQDGIDLSDKKIRFNYKNSNGKFYDIAVNVKYNDDVIRFSWLLPYSLTQPGGNVIASIDFYGYIEYDEQYSYKTKNFKLTVEKSLGVDDKSDQSYNNWTIKIENDVEFIQNKISEIEKDIKDIYVPTKLSEMDDDVGHRTVSDSQIQAWNEAQKNIQSDWNEQDINSDAYIKNKPQITNDLTDQLKSSYDDAVTNSHVHNNKTVLDNIDDQYIKKWNSAYSHSISSHAPENAQENIIEDIKINGVSTAISDKTVNITIPTKTSDITNDSGFITNITNNLVNYYLKSEVYTKEEVQSLIGRVSSLELIKVDALPTEDIKTSAIYLVPSDQSEENNIYTEYIYMDGQWEIIGDTSVDLSQYALNKDVNEIKSDIDNLKITGGIAFDYITIEVDDEEIPCTALSLNNTSLTFNGSGQQTLVATPTPIDTTDSITWASSNKSVATVSNGVVTSIGNGSCTITATCGTIKSTCTVNVSGITTTIPVTGVTLDQTTASVDVDSTITLVSTIQPTNASNQNVSWTSDNETVAKVINGVVTGISKGTATIRVMTEDGGYSATCNVTVNEVQIVTYRNLFDKDTMVTSNQGITSTGVIGNYNWGLARVPVKENTQYSIKMSEDYGGSTEQARMEPQYYNCATAGAIGFADSTGNTLISTLGLSNNQTHIDNNTNGANALLHDYAHDERVYEGFVGWVTFTTPSGCEYLLFNTTLKNNADKIQLEEGDTIHDYYLPYEGSEA